MHLPACLYWLLFAWGQDESRMRCGSVGLVGEPGRMTRGWATGRMADRAWPNLSLRRLLTHLILISRLPRAM